MLTSAAIIKFETLRSIAFGGIGANYSAVGGVFNNPIRILKISNETDESALISFNGIDDQDIVAANGFVLYDFTGNASAQAGVLELQAQKRIYVKQAGAAPTSGNLYVTAIYASTV
jgi:hypothetical protein